MALRVQYGEAEEPEGKEIAQIAIRYTAMVVLAQKADIPMEALASPARLSSHTLGSR